MGKCTRQAALEHKIKIWKLRVKGYTYEKIAEKVGVSLSTVKKALISATNEYKENFIYEVEKVKTEQIAEMDNVGNEAMRAWHRSKQSSKNIRQKQLKDAEGNKIGASENIIDLRDQDGDPRYLEVYMKAKEQIRKIIGADAPTRINVDFKSLSDAELKSIIENT